jgi:hypothetical protein
MVKGEPNPCPVPLCPGLYKTPTAMQSHFQHRHWQNTITITNEGALPRCERCLLFTSNANTDQHHQSQRCIAGTSRKERRELQLQNELGTETEFRINNMTIENVDHFKYLGRIITASGTDNIATTTNLRKARKVWARIATLL